MRWKKRIREVEKGGEKNELKEEWIVKEEEANGEDKK